jgi:hypothetical protein
LDLQLIHQLRTISKYAKAVEAPFPERLNMSQKLVVETGNKQDYSKIVLREASCIARLRAARVALCIERYRLAQGKLPDSIADLASFLIHAAFTDPFDGNQLRYERLTNGYGVYSVGEDGVDDGGDEKRDVTFTVER